DCHKKRPESTDRAANAYRSLPNRRQCCRFWAKWIILYFAIGDRSSSYQEKPQEKSDMTVEQIVRRQNAALFLPYRLFLANGRELFIQHPDFLSVAGREDLV